MRNLIILVLVLAVGGYFGIKWKLHSDVESGVDMAVLMMKPYVAIEYEGISSTLSGELTIDGIRGRVQGYDDEFSIGRFGIDTPSFLSLMKIGDMQSVMMARKDVLPDYFGIILEGLKMPVDADYGHTLHATQIAALGVTDDETPANRCTGKYGFSPQALVAMGYEEYDLTFNARFRQDGGRYGVEIHSGSANMWDVDATLELAGNMTSELAMGPGYRPKLAGMEIVYNDRSLKERVSAYCQRLGLTPEAALDAQVDAFRYVGSQVGIEFDEYVMDPYREFLGGKSTLVVTAKPLEPIPLSSIALYKPSDVPALLQLSAEAR
ncbi:MAG: hypothetical protein R3288_11760 [Woeseiaceae bacterium]|nr:hypothetical protein [Woeseiaceae bacterium]